MKEKRALESDGGDFLHPEPKRKRAPALASVVIEALKVDSLQKLCSSLEPILRRIVSEEVERALVKLGPARIGGRTSPKRIEGPSGRKLQLHFRSTLSLPLFTGGKVEGEQGSAIHVVLLDASTGHVVTLGPESSAKLDVVVLEGDFNNEDDDDWTEEEFESHIVKERDGKRPLLTGDLQISLKEGLGTLGELTFTDNSSWIRSRKFRLGLKISSGCLEGIRIREAKTEAFTVKDHRGELYKKHYPPSWKDDVWRLEKIGKDGSFHKKLNNNQIFTVEDFLRLYVRDSQKLRTILGGGMSNKMWESLIEHAKTCLLSGKYYVYYSDGTREIGAIFNHIYEFSGLLAGGQFCSAESLTDSQKVFADALVKRAYENWSYAIEYDGKALIGSKAIKNTTNFSGSYESEATLQSPVVDTGNIISSSSSSSVGLALAPSQYSNMGFQLDDWSAGPPSNNGATADDFLTEDEIRLRSHEILEHEDMQLLLRHLSMAGASSNIPDDGYGYPSYMPSPMIPTFNFSDEQSRSSSSSGKAVVGWLKIKAAMRWGIFIRKQVAEKRKAQLTELEEDLQ